MQYDEDRLLYLMGSIHELETERPAILESHGGILKPKKVGVYLPKATAVSMTNLDLTVRDMTGVLGLNLGNRLMAMRVSLKMEPGTMMEDLNLSLDVKTDTLYFLGASFHKPQGPSGDPEEKPSRLRDFMERLLPQPLGNPGLAFDNSYRG